MAPNVTELQAKSILIKTALPGADWVVNPYNGCLFACMYCYAAQIARWKHPKDEWGSYIDVKINAPQLLRIELEKLHKKLKTKDFGSIFFSSVTDPYNGMEAKYKLTQKCLETLANFGYEGLVTIQTKSDLITRDLNILKKLKKVSVGFTVTTLDDKVSRFMEVVAPPVSARLEALKKLKEEGINTYAFVGPILPYFSESPVKITEILDRLKEAGVKEVWFEHINLSSQIKSRLYEYLKKESPEIIKNFDMANTQEYRDNLDNFIVKEVEKREMNLGLGKVIHHRSLPKKK